MNKLTLFSLIFGLVLVSSNISYAKVHEVKGKHHEFDISCNDCHKTDKPTKKASQKACRSCHENQKEEGKVASFKDKDGREIKLNIHDSHIGDVRCTVCHTAHKKPKLYCNEACHHAFDITTP